MTYSIGDIVTRRSYNSDQYFKIEKIKGDFAILRSVKTRLMADAPINDLIKITNISLRQLHKELLLESIDYLKRHQRDIILNGLQMRQNKAEGVYREKVSRVLHLDGDQDYLKISLQNYNNLQIKARGFYISEEGQSEKVLECLKSYKPDILVITGHDGIYDGETYHTSNYFVKSVEIARNYENNLDELVIFAGACQSDYEKLIESGANFASSPAGKLIHFLDPILIVEKIAFTSIREVVKVKDVVKNTITGEGGIGGIETRGKLRLYYP